MKWCWKWCTKIYIKGTVNVILCDLPILDWHVWFTTVHMKLCLIKIEWDNDVFFFESFEILIFGFSVKLTGEYIHYKQLDSWKDLSIFNLVIRQYLSHYMFTLVLNNLWLVQLDYKPTVYYLLVPRYTTARLQTNRLLSSSS